MLSEIWGKIVGIDHHKMTDMVHYISTKYQFGAIEYHVEHGAYIGENIDKSFSTLESAENYLIEEFCRQIKSEIKENISRCETEDEYSQMVKPKEYWQELNEEFKHIESLKVDGIKSKINEEEYWNDKRKLESLEFERKYADEILLNNGIDSKDELTEPFGLTLSLGARIERLANKNK